jgi:hypothetical protein
MTTSAHQTSSVVSDGMKPKAVSGTGTVVGAVADDNEGNGRPSWELPLTPEAAGWLEQFGARSPDYDFGTG